ncbi:MAG TPA: hypothetical protein PLS50_08265, partial [Candidatus Dojkabacteria bacterium]|nr:hypothetical protein [Candidatus Dojkabacteria bacterium]
MGKIPKIHRTETGKRYIIINGRKVYIQPGVSKKQVVSLYKSLTKSIKPKKKQHATNINKATAVIKQYINRPRREKRKDKPFTSSIDPRYRVTVSGSDRHPKDSGDQDLINALKNKNNKLEIEFQNKRFYPLGYSTEERMRELSFDPNYRRLLQMQDPPRDEMEHVLSEHNLLSLYNSGMSTQPDTVEEEPEYVDIDPEHGNIEPEPQVKEESKVKEEYFDYPGHVALAPSSINEKLKKRLSEQREREAKRLESAKKTRERYAIEMKELDDEIMPSLEPLIHEEKKVEQEPEPIQIVDQFKIETVPINVLRLMINRLRKEGHNITKIPNTTKKDESGYRHLFSFETASISPDEIIDSFRKSKDAAVIIEAKKAAKPVYPVQKVATRR